MVKALSADVVANANREQIIEIVKSLTANAADYTFTFVGNFDTDQLKSLCEQYIASLPGNAKKAVHEVKKFDKAYDMVSGTGVDRATAKMENPQTWCAIIEWANQPYSSANAKMIDAIGQILSARLVKTVREKEGAVYSINADGMMDRIGEQNTMIQSAFPMKPEMEEKVLGMIKNEFNSMESNITEEELAPVREFMLKQIADGREKNGTWMGTINGWLINGVDNLDGAEEIWTKMTAADLMKLMKEVNKQGNYRAIILAPAE